jgi:hypothetical protein
VILPGKSPSRANRPGAGIPRVAERDCSPLGEVPTKMSRFDGLVAFHAVVPAPPKAVWLRTIGFGPSKNVRRVAKWEHYWRHHPFKLSLTIRPCHRQLQTFMLTLQSHRTITSI